MNFEKFVQLEQDDYGNGVLVQEYNGNFFLVEASKPQNMDGTVYKRWGQKFKKKGVLLTDNDGKPYNFPWSIKIGASIEEAKNTLRKIAQSLPGQDSDDVPF